MSDKNADNVADGMNIRMEDEPSSFKLILSLGIAGFLSGLLLVTVYLYTLPIIEANKAEALKKAIFKVLPACDSYETLVMQNSELVLESEFTVSSTSEEPLKIYAGFDQGGKFIGFAIPGSEPGFQDIIGVMFGFDPGSQIIVGFEVLESKETPGLGDKIFKDLEFQANFNALETSPQILAVKKGQKSNPNEVEAITGATISSKAVVRLLNSAVQQWQKPIERYIKATDMNQAEK